MPATVQPLVSVVITSYNYEAFVGRAIESALAQNYPSLEVIVCENGSTDNSLEVIKRYESDSRLKVVVNETNLGVIGNLNKGIAVSSGDFVVFLSADDYFLPGHIARAVECYGDNPNVDVVYSPALVVDNDGGFTRVLHQRGYPKYDSMIGRNELVELLVYDSFICFPTVLFKRDLLDELGPMDENLHVAADYEYVIRLAAAQKCFQFINEPRVVVRYHPDNRSSAGNYVASGQQILDYLAILERYVPGHTGQLTGFGAAIELLLDVRIADLNAYPIAQALLAELAPRIEQLRATLRAIPSVGDAEVHDPRPLVSVILPTLGEIGLLDQAVRSMQSQTYENWELIVFSDGGTNLQAYIASLPFSSRVRYLRDSEATSAAHARNRALAVARGDVVAYLDEDNAFKPSYLQRIVEAFRDPATMVTRVSADLVIEEFDRTISSARNVLRTVPDAFAVGEYGWVSLVNSNTPMNCVAHRRVCTLVINGAFDETLPVLEDWQFQLRLSSAFKVKIINESLVEVQFGRKMWHNTSLRNWSQYLPTLERLYTAYAAPQYTPQRQAYVNELIARVQALQSTGHGEEEALALILLISGARASAMASR
jgi:glycosyltransferase involved in cell wall biosynthesis